MATRAARGRPGHPRSIWTETGDPDRPAAKHGPGRRYGTHALRKRCPICRKLRRFAEPPGDQGGEREDKKGWHKLADGRWVCPQCPTAKVIFLDIDGVLNSVDWMQRIDGCNIWDQADGGSQLDPEAVKRLEYIVSKTGAQVVISSTWRKMYDVATIEGFLRRHGFTGKVIGETVHRIPTDERTTTQQMASVYQRGWEINAWLDEHPEVTHFVILDDDSDMDGVPDNFVHTRYPHGLVDWHFPKILSLLGVAS